MIVKVNQEKIKKITKFKFRHSSGAHTNCKGKNLQNVSIALLTISADLGT